MHFDTSIRDHEQHAAEVIGLAELRIGRHTCRDSAGKRTAGIWLSSFWTVRVMPSFHQHVYATIVEATGQESPRGTTDGWRKAVICAGGETYMSTNVPRGVEPTLNNLTLIIPEARITLDGIRYELSLNSSQLSGKLSFSNPRNEALCLFVSECYKLCRSLARQSQNRSLNETVNQWLTYIKDAE